MSTRNFWKLAGKSKLPPQSGLLEVIEPHPWNGPHNPVYHQHSHLVLQTVLPFLKRGISVKTTWLSLAGAIALSYPPIVIDDSSWKNTAERFAVALTLTLGGYESAIAPSCFILKTAH